MSARTVTFEAFVKLGALLRNFCENSTSPNVNFTRLQSAVTLSQQQNGWFTEENLLFSLKQWGETLTEEHLGQWLSCYTLPQKPTEKTVAIIMAGNIPLVGFHDFLSVLLTGDKALCKLASNDNVMLLTLADYLIEFEPTLKSRIAFTQEKLNGFDAVIATGSTNTSRYFEYYFKKYPHIIRKNRTSVAVLSGDESNDQLQLLGEDIFRYFGLGCRNVSKIYVPEGYDFDAFFNAMFNKRSVIDHHKYANNYDYNKAVYLMSEFKILDNGFMLLKEEKSFHSPISVVFYETYENLEALQKLLYHHKDALQCIVGDLQWPEAISFGKTQRPSLTDHADGVDTIDFLLNL